MRRQVALKVIKLGMDTKSVVARFEAERQALALMDHPNIAKVFDAGATETGRPFFVMELVRGIRITDYCDQAQLSTEQRLDLFIKVCQAIQHAHQKGIIHRDIKPSNILITLYDGIPVPKVIDFGISKATEGRLTDHTIYTQLHQFIGTPAYMSPEQAEMSGLDIDTRSDIYSLGVLLYELLAGRTPFETKELMASGLDAMRKIIREEEPVRPSTRFATLPGAELTTTAKRRSTETAKLLHQLKGDLDWIVMKCLEKDRSRRYETASGLAADLKRHLENEPVVARPPSATYRFGKAFRRNKILYISSVAIATALLVGLILSGWSLARERKALFNEQIQRREAEAQRKAAEASTAAERQERTRAEGLSYASDMSAVAQALDVNNLGRGQELLNRNRPQGNQPDRRGWEWRHLWTRVQSDELTTLGSHLRGVDKVAFSPNGNLLASGSIDYKVKFWNWKDQLPAGDLDITELVGAFAFSPDGQTLALCGPKLGCLLWDVSAKRETGELKVPFENLGAVAFSPRGNLLAVTAVPMDIQLWNPRSKSFEATLSGHKRPVHALAFSPDGQTLYSAGGEEVKIWDVAARREMGAFKLPTRWVTSLHVSPDGSMLAITTGDTGVRIWDIGVRQQIAQLTNHAADTYSAIFLPNGQLATAGGDQRIRFWDTNTWNELHLFKGHIDGIWSLALSPDGKNLASGGSDEMVKLWSTDIKATPLQHLSTSFTREDQPLRVAFSPDGHWLSLISPNRIALSDNYTLQEVRSFPLDTEHMKAPGAFAASALGQDGHILYFGDNGGAIRTLDLNTGFEGRPLSGHKDAIVALALSRNGQRLVSGSRDRTIQLQEIAGRKPAVVLARGDSHGPFCFSPDGQRLAYPADDDGILLWDLSTGAAPEVLKGHKGKIVGLDFSPDGKLLASASWDATAALWEVATRRRLASLRVQRDAANSVAFSRDGARLAAGSGAYIKMWCVNDLQEVLTLRGFPNASSLTFLPGDEGLVACGFNYVHRWPAPALKDILQLENRSQRKP